MKSDRSNTLPTSDPSRREFLSSAGAGLFVFFPIAPLVAQEPARLPIRVAAPSDFNAFLKIGADGRVSGFAGKVELGQGATTALAQLLADELDVAFDSIDMTLGDTDLCPYDMGTFGSMCMPITGPIVRAAAAEARAVLLQMAAERLQSPVERLRVKDGVVTDTGAAAKRVTYAQLVEGRRIERHLQDVPRKNPGAFTVIGQSPRRKDALDKVTGKAKYAGDMVRPGLLHARILPPPAHGATLANVDTSAAEKVPGVRVIKENDLVAVLHERRDTADKAVGLLKAQFRAAPAGPDDQTIFDHLLKTGPPPQVVGQNGNLAEGEKSAASVVEQTYLNSYVAHAPMEPHSATVSIENGKATVWASTQAPFSVRGPVAQALGLGQQDVRVIAGSVGEIAFWDYAVVGAGDRNAAAFYDIPHSRTTSAGGWQGGNPAGMHPFGVGPWRAPSVNTNTFARESHIDMLANKAGVDPLQFRIDHLSDKRMIRVLQAAAERFGWKPGKTPSGRGVGVSCGMYSATYSAMCAEVAVDKSTGRVQVKRVALAQDQGLTVSPDGSRQQMEGCITMGLGQALTEEVRFK